MIVGLGRLAAALAFAGILSRAAVIARLAAALTLAGVFALAVVLRYLCFLRFVVLPEERGPGNQTRSRGSESDGKFSAIHQTASLGRLVFVDEHTAGPTAAFKLTQLSVPNQEGWCPYPH